MRGRRPGRIAAPRGDRLPVLGVDESERVLAQGNDVLLRAAHGSRMRCETLNRIQESQDQDRFLRSPRSRIARIDVVEQPEPCIAGRDWPRLRNGLCLASGHSDRQPQLRACRPCGLSG